jgi:hypothetical protein
MAASNVSDDRRQGSSIPPGPTCCRGVKRERRGWTRTVTTRIYDVRKSNGNVTNRGMPSKIHRAFK